MRIDRLRYELEVQLQSLRSHQAKHDYRRDDEFREEKAAIVDSGVFIGAHSGWGVAGEEENP